jgi:hypothetical protein
LSSMGICPFRITLIHGIVESVKLPITLQWQAAISDVSMTGNLHVHLLPQNTSIWDETWRKIIALIDSIKLVD